MNHKKEEIYFDLSKCSEEEIKKIHFILRNKDENIHTATARDLINGMVTHCYWFLFFDGNAWNQNETLLSGKKEINFQQFCELFQSEEKVEVEIKGWIKIETEKDLPKKEGKYWTHRKNGIIIEEFFYSATRYAWLNFYNVTHYQPILVPEPPKF